MIEDELLSLAEEVAGIAQSGGFTVGAAESVTGGTIATALAAAPDASEWFPGSIVAYGTGLKRELLGVTAADVITAECARQMAEGALRVTAADLVVSVTGVGGPGPEDGHPAGTVFIGVGDARDLRVFEHRLDGEPDEVVRSAALRALRHLAEAARTV